MPTISFVSPKGGAGKTTSALLLATQLAARGAQVTIIDADPNHPVRTWGEGGNVPENLTIVSNPRPTKQAEADVVIPGVETRQVNSETIRDVIEETAKESQFVIVDLEGTAELIVGNAIAESDFVVVPTQGSQLDAEQAGRAFALIRAHERTVQKYRPDYSLPYAVVFTRTNVAIMSRDTRFIRKTFEQAGIPFLDVELHERAAFKSVFSYQRPLDKLDPKEVSGVEKAVENAEAFTREIVTRIRDAMQQQKQVKVAS
ncbi:ParA family protein [Caballeronia sp. TF1N1]|uniref:ParA family protein n=1 Tax=Caballeronia sp. TF1N1 TaxID=2878153 RepID=UPI001FD5072F|nr:ParA family protein [Caballeronia sp. TF1N1]